MNSLRYIALYNIQNKRRFQFQSLFQKQQVKNQLKSLIQQVQLFFEGGLTPKQMMRVLNGVDDQVLNSSFDMHKVDFDNIKVQVDNYDTFYSGSSLDFARDIINKTFKENQ